MSWHAKMFEIKSYIRIYNNILKYIKILTCQWIFVKFRDKVRVRRFQALSTSFLIKTISNNSAKWRTQYSLSNLYCLKNYGPSMWQILPSQVNTHRNSHGVNYSPFHSLSCQKPCEIELLICISPFLDCFHDKVCKIPILFERIDGLWIWRNMWAF